MMIRRDVLLALSCVAVVGGTARAEDDEAAIRALLSATFDRPDAPLLLEPVVIHGSHAIAGWTQGDMGGRALLRRGSTWTIVLCAGDALREASTLQDAGLDAASANELAGELRRVEAGIAPQRLAMLARFEGIVQIEADGSHPTAHEPSGHGHGSAHGTHGGGG